MRRVKVHAIICIDVNGLGWVKFGNVVTGSKTGKGTTNETPNRSSDL